MRFSQTVASLGVVFVVALSSSAARADSVDGDWCSTADARSFSIQGPRIVTPGKHSVIGSYGRHYFSYVVPDGETEAGAAVEMQLLNEETIQVKVGDRDSEIWHRCQVISQSSRPWSST